MARSYRLRKKPIVLAVRRKPTKMTTKKVASIAKKVVLRQEETKSQILQVGYSVAKQDTLYTTNLLQALNQGTSGQTRIGDIVHLTGFKIKFIGWHTNAPTVGRIMVVRCKKDTAPSEAQLFDSATPSTWMVNRNTNTEYVKVLYDRRVVLTSSASLADPNPVLREIWVNIKSKHIFDGDNSDFGKYYNYYLCYISHTPDATQGTTDSSLYGFDCKIYWKDA